MLAVHFDLFKFVILLPNCFKYIEPFEFVTPSYDIYCDENYEYPQE